MLWISLHSPLPQLRARALIAVSEIPGVNPGGINLVCRYKLAVISKFWQKPPQPPSLPAELAQEALGAVNFPESWQELFVGKLSLSRGGERLRALKLSFDTSLRAHRAVLRQGDGHHFTAELGICGLWCVGMVFPTPGSALEFGGTTGAQCSCQQCF